MTSQPLPLAQKLKRLVRFLSFTPLVQIQRALSYNLVINDV